MFRRIAIIACLLFFIGAQVSFADPVVLTFEGIPDEAPILNFYSSLGITFGPDALALIDGDNGGGGNFANEPSPNTVAYFLTGPGVVMNVPGGFDTGFSFFYTSAEVASVSVFDGVDGGGTLLATIPLLANWTDGTCVGDPTGSYCHWDPIGVAFAGIAKSVNFGGAANRVAFDNITVGAAHPVIMPEPASMILVGTGVLAAGLRRRFAKK